MDARGQWVTLFLMIAIAAFIIVSDVALARAYGSQATYSWVSADLIDRYPVLILVAVFAVGVLIGHVLLPIHTR